MIKNDKSLERFSVQLCSAIPLQCAVDFNVEALQEAIDDYFPEWSKPTRTITAIKLKRYAKVVIP